MSCRKESPKPFHPRRAISGGKNRSRFLQISSKPRFRGSEEAITRVRRRIDGIAYRSAIGLALAAACMLVWLSLGVGIIGADGDPANLMYFGVLAVGIIGALI